MKYIKVNDILVNPGEALDFITLWLRSNIDYVKDFELKHNPSFNAKIEYKELKEWVEQSKAISFILRESEVLAIEKIGLKLAGPVLPPHIKTHFDSSLMKILKKKS
ncbi:MAG TPA: hypothetical protein VK590_04920 [Saprospiraceae bacterium]|nr:hypothetical protein [Saprospiraceae bacterium]